MSMRPRPAVVVLVADARRVSRFYRDLAEMRVLSETESHVVLEVDGLEVVVHALAGEPAPDVAPGTPVQPREDSYLKLCLPVGSIAAARSVAAAHGGLIRPSGDEWEARGFRACDGYDPEGNVLQVREAAGRPGAASSR